MVAPPTAGSRMADRGFAALTGGLFVLAAAACIWVDLLYVIRLPFGVDVEIPLLAAGRWLHGGLAYDPAAFSATTPTGLPFLYPPYTLPVIAPLTWLPAGLVIGGWLVISLGAATFACRRLGVAWRWLPFVLAWPPFVEPLVTGNVQVVLLAAFVAVFTAPGWRPAGVGATHAPGPDRTDRDRTFRPLDGLLTAFVGAFKPANLQPLAFLVVRRPRDAAVGIAAFAALAVITLPLVGLQAWSDWVAQASRAADPHVGASGMPLGVFLPPAVAVAITVITVVVAITLGGRRTFGASGQGWLRTGALLGLLMVAGSPSVHEYSFLFVLPAALMARRDLALIGALLIGTYTGPGLWVGFAVIAVPFILSERWPRLSAAATSAGGLPVDLPAE